ncbi:hypothetical protein BDR03DRAFT_589175, partial [Suillus americanus]
VEYKDIYRTTLQIPRYPFACSAVLFPSAPLPFRQRSCASLLGTSQILFLQSFLATVCADQVMRANSSVPCPAFSLYAASASLRGYNEVSSRCGTLRPASVSGFLSLGCCGHLSRDTRHISPLLHSRWMVSASCRCHMTTLCGCGMLRLARRRRPSVLLRFRQVKSTLCLDLNPCTRCTSYSRP